MNDWTLGKYPTEAYHHLSHLKEKLCSKIETSDKDTTAALGSPGELLSFGGGKHRN